MKGKCKEDFEKWYLDEYNKLEYEYYDFPHLEDFFNLHLSMQWGVIVDFFDSAGIDVGVNKYGGGEDFMWFAIKDDLLFREFAKNRHEARTEAIEKAVEIYNEKI